MNELADKFEALAEAQNAMAEELPAQLEVLSAKREALAELQELQNQKEKGEVFEATQDTLDKVKVQVVDEVLYTQEDLSKSDANEVSDSSFLPCYNDERRM